VTLPLSQTQRAEIDSLAAAHGPTARVRAPIPTAFADPLARRDRVGEVCMVIRRPSGRLLVNTKIFYPPGAYRLLTGGIGPGERIADALARETREETGLETRLRRFLAAIDYHDERERDGPPVFHTFAFLLDEVGGTLGSLDPDEQILDYREVAIGELQAVAAKLERLSGPSQRIGGSWGDWGRFRAVVHRAVAELALEEAQSSRKSR
jgi:ADP-ribose pyrophosphatase YjhB (NUDIX family)